MVWPGQLTVLLSPHTWRRWVNVLSMGAGSVAVCTGSCSPSTLQCQFSKSIADPPCGAELCGSWRPFSSKNHWLMDGTARDGPTRAGCTWPCEVSQPRESPLRALPSSNDESRCRHCAAREHCTARTAAARTATQHGRRPAKERRPVQPCSSFLEPLLLRTVPSPLGLTSRQIHVRRYRDIALVRVFSPRPHIGDHPRTLYISIPTHVGTRYTSPEDPRIFFWDRQNRVGVQNLSAWFPNSEAKDLSHAPDAEGVQRGLEMKDLPVKLGALGFGRV